MVGKQSTKFLYSPKVRGIDLFCGVGGLTRGMEKAGIDVQLGVDIDPACQFPYTVNNEAKFLLKSVEEPGGTWRNLEEPGGTWRNLEEPGGTWRNLEGLG